MKSLNYWKWDFSVLHIPAEIRHWIFVAIQWQIWVQGHTFIQKKRNKGLSIVTTIITWDIPNHASERHFLTPEQHIKWSALQGSVFLKFWFVSWPKYSLVHYYVWMDCQNLGRILARLQAIPASQKSVPHHAISTSQNSWLAGCKQPYKANIIEHKIISDLYGHRFSNIALKS